MRNGYTLAVRMPVVDVREVCVAVLECHVLVRMGMRLHTVPGEIVAVLVVFVVPVLVPML